MKSPADTWNEAYGDVFPFDRVDSLARILLATGYWLGASAAVNAVHDGEGLEELIEEVEEAVRTGAQFPEEAVERLVSARN